MPPCKSQSCVQFYFISRGGILFFRFKEFRLAGVLGFFDSLSYFLNQMAGIIEVAIDTCESNVCDLIDSAQIFHYAFTDKSRGDFFIEVFKYILFDPVSNLLNLLGRYRSFIAGFLDTCNNFLPVIRNT